MGIGMHIDIKKKVAVSIVCPLCGRDLDFSTKENVAGDEFIFSPEPCCVPRRARIATAIMYVADLSNRHVATIQGLDEEKIRGEFNRRFGGSEYQFVWHPRTYGIDGNLLMGVDVKIITVE